MTIILRPMRESDLDMVLSWRNSDDVRRNMYTHHMISKEEHMAWWASQHENPTTRLLICEMDAEPVGVVTFTRYTGEGGVATWAFYSGNRSQRGVGRVMEAAALAYAFEKLLVRRLECEVLSFNRPVVDFHLKHGFTLEGVARQAYERNGELHDIFRLSMLAEEWFRRIKELLESGALQKSLAGHCVNFPVHVSADLVNAYAGATGDDNPVHLDSEEARRLGFPGRIAHGMLLGAFFSRCFANNFPGRGTIYVSQSLRFHAPVLVGSDAVARFKVISHIGRRITVDTSVSVNDKICVSGEAVLVLPEGFQLNSPNG